MTSNNSNSDMNSYEDDESDEEVDVQERIYNDHLAGDDFDESSDDDEAVIIEEQDNGDDAAGNAGNRSLGDYTVHIDKTINIEYGKVDKTLLSTAREEFKAVVQKVLIGCNNHLHAPSREGLLTMQLFMLYFGDINTMFEWCTKYSKNPDETFLLDDIYGYLHTVLLAMSYNTSVTHLFKCKGTGFHRKLLITEERYYTIYGCLNRNRSTHHQKNEWDHPIHANQDMRTIFNDFGRRCSRLCFIPGKSMLGIDDDMWRHRSKTNIANGMAPINNPKKGNGLVHHAAVSVATGLYCGGYLQHKGESTDTCVLNVQQILCRVITNDAIDLKGTIFFMDRGYGGVDGRITLTMIENGGLVHGTAKRDASIPYVYGESKRRVQPTQQKELKVQLKVDSYIALGAVTEGRW